MNFLHIHTTDVIGGAAISMNRLHQALKKEGHESRVYCGQKASVADDVFQIVPGRYGRYSNRKVGEFFNAVGLQGVGNPSGLWIRTSPLIRQWADVAVIRNLHGDYFPLNVLPWIAQRVPVILRLPDMWALTGHCAYSYDCTRWQTGCGQCPYLDEYPALPFDTTRFLWKNKQRIYQKLKGRVVLVSPSRWLAGLVQQSPLLKEFPCEYIPTAVDLNVFKPADKNSIRARFKIADSAKVVMLSSVYLSDPRKGSQEMIDFLKLLAQRSPVRLTLLLVGNVSEGIRQMLKESFDIVTPGFISSDDHLASCYQTADVYVSLSRADNLPNTLVEAAACGLPAVTLDRGGCKEAVVEKESGYVVENWQQAVEAVLDVLREEPRQKMFSVRARELAQERFSMDNQLKAYVRLAEALQGQCS